MSRVLLRSTLHCNYCTHLLVSNKSCNRGLFSIFQSVNNCTKRDEIGQTTILLEDGSNIRELPVILRKVSNNSVIFCENKTSDSNGFLANFYSKKEGNKDDAGGESSENLSKIPEQDLESKDILDYFNKCYTARGIFAILETIPSDEVTPSVSLQALRRIVTLENNKAIRNSSIEEIYKVLGNDSTADGLSENETFTRTAVLSRLVDKILSSSDQDILLSGFLIVNRDMIGKYIDQDTKQKFTNEILCRVTDGKFTIKQTCEAIKMFSDIAAKPTENVDKLWVGITEKINEVDKNNFMDVARSIPYLDKSRKVVLSVIEKKLFDIWYTIQGHDVAEILVILKQVKSNSPTILGLLSQWVNKNIHTATEDDLIEIINGFCSIGYNNNGIEQALERYVKAKGVSIKNPTLVANFMDYCSKFHIRSPILLQGAAEYLVVHGNSLSPVLLQRLFLPLGKLNYQPSNGMNFWKVLEYALEEKFVQFRPEEVIDMLLHCIYLKKYPLNFVKKVFNPYFLDRLHSYKNQDLVNMCRFKLQILDMALTLECSQYHGPVLPKSINSPPIWQDGRVKRIVNNLRGVLCDVAGGSNKFAFNIVPVQLPATNIYVIDALILNKDSPFKLWPINLDRDYNMHTAILVHPPEHYCSHGAHLTGEQEMRKRHFQHLGLKVASLNLNHLAKLRVHPKALRDYIQEKLSLAEPPFPKAKSF